MKLAYFAAALALSGSSLAAATTSPNTDACTAIQQASAYTTLAGVLTTNDLSSCSESMSLNLLYTTSLPTDAQYAVMCRLTSCQALVQTIIAMNPPDCSLTIPTSGMKANVYALVHAYAGKCEAILNPATTAPPATEAPVTEAPVTEAPVTEEPATEEPATEEPETEEPETEEPETEEPETEEPATEEPATEEPVTEEPVTEEPATEEPVTDAPETDVPVVTTRSPSVCDW